MLNGLNYASIRLKNGATAKISHGKNFVNCLIVRNGKIEGGCGMRGPQSAVENQTAYLYGKLGKAAAEPFDDIEAIAKGYNPSLDTLG